MQYPICIGKLCLTEQDCSRILTIAEFFGFQVKGTPEVGMRIERAESQLGVDFSDWSTGIVRLVTEIASLTMRWIRYSVDEPCSTTLLRLPDSRLRRIAALEARHDRD